MSAPVPSNQTEDSGNSSGFYRFVPQDADALERGGRLQILKVTGAPKFDAASGQTVGKALACEWVDIADPDPNLAAGRATASSRDARRAARSSTGKASTAAAAARSTSSRRAAAKRAAVSSGNTGRKAATRGCCGSCFSLPRARRSTRRTNERRRRHLSARAGPRQGESPYRHRAGRCALRVRGEPRQRHRVRRRLLQPQRRDLVRQHLRRRYAALGHDLRHPRSVARGAAMSPAFHFAQAGDNWPDRGLHQENRRLGRGAGRRRCSGDMGTGTAGRAG